MKNIIRGIKNIWKWLPIIWQDRDWDYGFMLKILVFKLENMEWFMRNKGMCVPAVDIADEIKETLIIGKRLLDDNYDLFPFWPYCILNTKNDLAFAQNKNTKEIITKREFFDIASKSKKEKDKDLEDFVNKFKNMTRWWD